MNAIDRLGLLGTRPGKFSQDHVRGGLEVHSHTRGKEGTHDDLDVVIVGKSIDGALALRRALVASNGGGGDSHRSKMRFCGVKNIDVFGKEDHFAHVTGQLSGVIRCHDRFGLANFSHQGKDVVAGIILLGLVNFRGGHQTHQVIVDLVTFGTTCLDDPVIPLEQTGDECAFGLDNGAPCFAIEFDGNICDSSGRNIFSDILLFPAHNTHGNYGFAGFEKESRIGRRETRCLKLCHQLSHGLFFIDPTQELPNHPEILDLVNERGSRQGHEERVSQPCPNGLRNRLNCLRALRILVFDEMRFVDDHSAEIKLGEPSHVTVKNVVVHNEDITKRIELNAVTVHNGGAPAGQPLVYLAQPICFHDIGNNDQQGKSSRRFRSNQRLGGFSQPRLIGEQETAVAFPGAFDKF